MIIMSFHCRPKGETPEERKARREAVKAERRIRRMEKKINKVSVRDVASEITARPLISRPAVFVCCMSMSNVTQVNVALRAVVYNCCIFFLPRLVYI